MIEKPSASEYGGHFGTYINQVPEGELLTLLEQQKQLVIATFGKLSEEQTLHRYAPGKWSLKEVLGHMIDTEWIMSVRLLRIARGDKTPLPGFDEGPFVLAADFDRLSLSDLLEQYVSVRQSTVLLLKNLSLEALAQMGTASGHPTSARALAYIIAGHERHHLTVVEERYLAQ